MLRVTLDTNTVDRKAIEEACSGHDVDVRVTTVTQRELEGTDFKLDNLCSGEPVAETLVIGESRLGHAVVGDDLGADRFESILDIVSDGTFPKPERRGELSPGHRRQLRDAMILEAHVRSGRDVLVTEDARGFIGRDGEKRRRLEALCRTRIMTVREFCDHLSAQGSPAGPDRGGQHGIIGD